MAETSLRRRNRSPSFLKFSCDLCRFAYRQYLRKPNLLTRSLIDGPIAPCKFSTDGGRRVAKNPRISIVIPVFNEAPCLVKLYDELTAVCDPLPYVFEFLFVNDGSTDETEKVLAKLR